MRALALLAVLVVLGSGLAGCIGAAKEDDTDTLDPAKVTTEVGGQITSGGGTGLPANLKVLAPLTSTLTLSGPEWIQSGTTVDASVAPPANAKGAVTYIWATGPLPDTVEVVPAKADTGSPSSSAYIAPGTSKNITFTTPGVYRMHCHPHPNMRSNVTVIDGYQGPKTVDVYIVDEGSPVGARYVPENIVIGVGTTVVYHDVGQLPHTATSLAQEPPLKKVALAGASGAVPVEGEGWQRVVVAMIDSEGRVGFAEQRIYTSATLPTFEPKEYAFAFEFGAPVVPGAPAQPASPKTESFKLDQAAVLTINYTFADAVGSASGGAENLAQVEMHLTPQGDTQDVMTTEPTGEGVWEGKVPAGTYTLTVIPRQGAQISGTVSITGAYELVPPSAGMSSSSMDMAGMEH